jgi:regulator of cell morphogenesis and NO signaling
MNLPFSTNTLVKDIVNELPKSSDVFKHYRIDFCCGGNISLTTAAEQSNVDVATLMDELAIVFDKSTPADKNLDVWLNTDTNTIIDHVINHYHHPLMNELAELSPYVTKVSRVHGDTHPELLRVKDLFYEFKKEMTEHSAKEEETVFPLIQKLADNSVENREETVNFIRELEKEHDHVGAILKELREITSDFTPPLDGCGTYRLVYKRLEMLEGETFMHVHLEQNILFPRYI